MLRDATGAQLGRVRARGDSTGAADGIHASGRFCDGLLQAGGYPQGADARKPDVTRDFIMVHRTMLARGSGDRLHSGDVPMHAAPGARTAAESNAGGCTLASEAGACAGATIYFAAAATQADPLAASLAACADAGAWPASPQVPLTAKNLRARSASAFSGLYRRHSSLSEER